MTQSILYSFRRCPYAMRARMALIYAGVEIELREILLKSKPEAMCLASPKATVPVLITDSGAVIDESRDVMLWALGKNDPQSWLHRLSNREQQVIVELIDHNDLIFKPWLDKYKYSVGYPERSEGDYRAQAEHTLQKYEQHLEGRKYFLGNRLSMADIAIFPFVRQFVFVDKAWFDNSQYQRTKMWLTDLLASKLFGLAMEKHAPWQSGDSPIVLPNLK